MFKVNGVRKSDADWFEISIEKFNGDRLTLEFLARYHPEADKVELGRFIHRAEGPFSIGLPEETLRELQLLIVEAIDNYLRSNQVIE